MITKTIEGYPVVEYAEIDPPVFPVGCPVDGKIEKTKAFLIVVSEEGEEDYERYWLRCLGVTGKVMAGEMCYSIEEARAFPKSEFNVGEIKWKKTEQGRGNADKRPPL
ncbi:hypothetical protein [Pelagicoccus mobilis]|uniref:Uncharacterized protein n=1 Tax=Pelagicoccus mobilis TaxID=415221 RepID=A0A934RRX5_9BACT|nr:hypothetical protein [Pelagicoccus mobilis]MBK1875762.1 hypothetical protein [Pelagicoccus mobilis]